MESDLMEIINLNGVEYIKREMVKQMETDLKNMRATMTQINQLSNNSPTDVVIANKDVSEVEVKYTRKKVNINDKDIFQVPPKSKIKWDIKCMDEYGVFFAPNNRKLRVTIKEVFIAQKELTRKTTVKEARDLRKKLKLNEYTFNKLVYNIQEGTFTKFIQQWNRNTQPTTNKNQVPVENNPEKRKELGIYG